MAKEEYNPAWKKKYGITREQWDGANEAQVEQFKVYTNRGVFGSAQDSNIPNETISAELQHNLGKILFPEPSSKVNLNRLFGVKK